MQRALEHQIHWGEYAQIIVWDNVREVAKMLKTIPFNKPLSPHNTRSAMGDLRSSISASERKMLKEYHQIIDKSASHHGITRMMGGKISRA